ncbi:alpha/beta fold hydrolase [Candidatus Bipolaricaulota bacterium]|nr:alpha/beta fold hydrolase [Candidatus Bipolaricaulota bacterium]
MNTKLLIGLGVALGLLLLVLVAPSMKRVEPAPYPESELVDAGQFVLEQDGERILEESYTLFFHPVDGYMLLSQGTLTVADQTIALSQQTQYDRNFMPIFYHLAADTPSGAQIISAQMGIAGLEMEVLVGLARQSAQVSDVANLALLDNNLIGQYAVLLHAIRSEAIDREFTAAIPQALLSLPARVEGPNTVEFTSGGETFEGKQFDVHLGDTRIVLIEFAGRLVGLMNRSQGTLGYDISVFPEGISVGEAAAAAATPVEEREIAFASDGLTLYGTLALPEVGEGPFPAVLFVHGSGPVDRDGNAIDLSSGRVAMPMDVYGQLAHALAEAGIASLRFDKRGVGASDGDSATASRSDLLDDVRAAVDALRAQPEVDPQAIILAGHSEGGYLAPVIATEDADVAGVILLAGAARSLDLITRWQVENLLVQQGVTGDALAGALVHQDEYVAFVEGSQGEWSDYTVEDIRAALPWLSDQQARQLRATPLALSWLREHYLAEPSETIRAVEVPVLIIQGEKDAQIPASEAGLLEQLLAEAGNGDVTVALLPDLNHLMRYHPEEPNLVYRHIEDPVDGRVIRAIVDWLTARWL